MAELKQGFENLNYTKVKTYLNSGNVIFSSDEADTIKTTSRIEEMIKNQFRLDIFLSLSYQRKNWKTFYIMRPTGGEMKVRRFMTI